ncbi:MAG: sugar phosphate isomerase/epimerase [Chloroflexaceae bacterium]|jgi:sugar phosphate isomerase/epimerase|nr:sugar phosphate isomerase/epimerase [Chloroflexaceae bacterium]
MSRPLALQLYTVRHALSQDFEATVRRVAALGYAGVEPFSFAGTTPAAAASLFRELGLAVPSMHVPMPTAGQPWDALDHAATLDCPCLVSGRGPEHFTTPEGIQQSCTAFNAAYALAQAQGRRFAIHNHWWEFEPTADGRLVYEVMLEQLDPGVEFEVDIYWVKTAGADPAAVLRRLGSRARLLHVKDGPAVQNAPMLAVGSGTVDVPGALAAGAAADWLIVELDEFAGDMFDAVAQSFNYLVQEGLGHGRTH